MEQFLYKNAFFYYSFSDCAYIEGQNTKFHNSEIKACSEDFYGILLERGWRRFGEMFFAPFCDFCKECISIRNIVPEFEPSKNHKRVLRNCAHLRINIHRPFYHIDKLALYNKYHSQMNIKKGWEFNQIDRDRYFYLFLDGYEGFGKEISYYDGDRLIGVAFVDIVESAKAMSAIYFFYDHDYSHLSLGTFSILTQLRIAKNCDLMYFYPGYWIKSHHSLGYKERFKPFEVLVNRPNIHEKPIWKRYRDS